MTHAKLLPTPFRGSISFFFYLLLYYVEKGKLRYWKYRNVDTLKMSCLIHYKKLDFCGFCFWKLIKLPMAHFFFNFSNYNCSRLFYAMEHKMERTKRAIDLRTIYQEEDNLKIVWDHIFETIKKKINFIIEEYIESLLYLKMFVNYFKVILQIKKYLDKSTLFQPIFVGNIQVFKNKWIIN